MPRAASIAARRRSLLVVVVDVVVVVVGTAKSVPVVARRDPNSTVRRQPRAGLPDHRRMEHEPLLAYERLDVYRVSIEVLAAAHKITSALPKGRAPLADQFRRAAISVPLNIAEGDGPRRCPALWHRSRLSTRMRRDPRCAEGPRARDPKSCTRDQVTNRSRRADALADVPVNCGRPSDNRNSWPFRPRPPHLDQAQCVIAEIVL